MTYDKDVYECAAKACGTALSSDELWSCADCGELFCESHITDLLDEHRELVAVGERGSIYLCPACLLRRMKVGVQHEAAHEREWNETKREVA
jgi:hypothetical protein